MVAVALESLIAFMQNWLICIALWHQHSRRVVVVFSCVLLIHSSRSLYLGGCGWTTHLTWVGCTEQLCWLRFKKKKEKKKQLLHCMKKLFTLMSSWERAESSNLLRFCVANKELNVSAAPASLLICHSAALQVRVYALNLVLPPKGSH